MFFQHSISDPVACPVEAGSAYEGLPGLNLLLLLGDRGGISA